MPEPVKLDFSKAVPINDAGTVNLDFSKAQQISEPPAAPKEGFWQSLGHTFGVGKEEGEAQKQELKQHPIASALKAAGGPAVQLAEGAYQGGKRIAGELGQGITAASEGNPAKVAEHGAYALPFVGAGIKRGVEQLGPNEGINPAEVGTALGTAIQTAPMVAEGMRPVVKPIADTITKTPGNVARSLTNTGKETAKGLVEKTQENRELVGEKAKEIGTKDAMEAARQRNQEKVAAEGHESSAQGARAKAEAEHKAAQGEYFRKQAEHKTATEKTEAENQRLTQEHKAATEQHGKLQSSLNEGERSAKVDLKKVEDRVHTDADNLYKTLKPKLASYEADPESTAEIVYRAHENTSALESKPPLFEKFEKLVKNKSGALTYDELDDARSRIGAAMRKGGLSGGTYHLYEVMLEGDKETGVPGIVDEMDRIAKDHGLREEAGAARNAWRSWAESFRDRSSPLRSILADPETHGLLGNMRGQQSFLARLRAFGPDGVQLADRIEKDLNTAHGSKAQFTKYGTIEVPSPKPPKLGEVKPFTERAPEYKPPQGGPAPKPHQRILTSGSPLERATSESGKPTTVGAEDLTQANKEAMAAKEKKARTGYSPLLTSVFVFDAIRNAMEGNWGNVGMDVAARSTYEVGKQGYAALLRSPKVIEFLSKPTAEQIAQVPPEMRGANLQPILDAAKKQGIQIDPRIAALAAAGVTANKKSVGDLLKPQ